MRVNTAGLGSGNSTTFGVSVFDIIDYTSTSKYKTMKSSSGVTNNDTTTGNQGVSMNYCMWMSTAAVTSITLTTANTGFTATSTFALYGIK
jgi:hypothetical protein